MESVDLESERTPADRLESEGPSAPKFERAQDSSQGLRGGERRRKYFRVGTSLRSASWARVGLRRLEPRLGAGPAKRVKSTGKIGCGPRVPIQLRSRQRLATPGTPIMHLSNCLALEEAAHLLRIGERTAYSPCRPGQLPGDVKVGGRWRVDCAALERCLRQGGDAPCKPLGRPEERN